MNQSTEEAKSPLSSTGQLRARLSEPGLLTMPCCWDAWSARLIERAGFPLTFMSGFAVSAARLGLPDTQLISYGEMVDQGRGICSAVSIPVIGDADTGYGNPLNVKRTLHGYAAADFAGAMIEDQVAPKRCGHVRGKAVVSQEEAVARIRAAVDAREEGADLLIIARTDACASEGLEVALDRGRAFRDLGADILFIEAPTSRGELEQIARVFEGTPQMVNIVEEGKTPLLSFQELNALGFKIAALPLTLLEVATKAIEDALQVVQAGAYVGREARVSFDRLREIAGFPEYFQEAERYASLPEEVSSKRRPEGSDATS